MAFEDRYYRSTTYGLINLRYKPVDPTLMPMAAIADAANIPGHFCLAKVTCKYGHNLKKGLPARQFSEVKPVLLSELNVSIVCIQRDIDKLWLRETIKVELVVAASRKDYTGESALLLNAQRECMEMTDAINHWTYEEGLCNHATLANCVK